MFCKAQCGGLPRYCAVEELDLLFIIITINQVLVSHRYGNQLGHGKP